MHRYFGIKPSQELGMGSVFEKLTLKDHGEIIVLNAPASFESELASLGGVDVLRDLQKVEAVSFALVFATRQSEVDAISPGLVDKLKGDALLWFAYPKGTSRKYTCDFNRNTGWRAIRRLGFDTVRAVAIDDDWSALRFRRVEFIKAGHEQADSEIALGSHPIANNRRGKS